MSSTPPAPVAHQDILAALEMVRLLVRQELAACGLASPIREALGDACSSLAYAGMFAADRK